MKESRSNREQNIGAAILLLLPAGCLLLLLPFVSALLWALVLPISTWPLYRRHRDPASIAFVWQAIILETKP